MSTGESRARRTGTGEAAGTDREAYAHTGPDGRTYYLHGKPVVLQNGRAHTVYYFASMPKAGEMLDALPPGYRVVESTSAGRPFLRKE